MFNMFKVWGPTKDLELKRLSLKVAVLLLLVSSQRGQTIVSLSTDNMILEEEITFQLKTLLKHNRLGDRLDSLTFRPYDRCKRLCVVRTLKAYLAKTEGIRGSNQLLLSYMRPHGPISRDTLSRWTLEVMKQAGVDVSKYKGHSTRGASTSAAKRLGIPVNLILKQASWKSAQSFAKYYDKEIEKDTARMANTLLNDVH